MSPSVCILWCSGWFLPWCKHEPRWATESRAPRVADDPSHTYLQVLLELLALGHRGVGVGLGARLHLLKVGPGSLVDLVEVLVLDVAEGERCWEEQ
jgi:hypothetical protein